VGDDIRIGDTDEARRTVALLCSDLLAFLAPHPCGNRAESNSLSVRLTEKAETR